MYWMFHLWCQIPMHFKRKLEILVQYKLQWSEVYSSLSRSSNSSLLQGTVKNLMMVANGQLICLIKGGLCSLSRTFRTFSGDGSKIHSQFLQATWSFLSSLFDGCLVCYVCFFIWFAFSYQCFYFLCNFLLLHSFFYLVSLDD